MVEVIRSEDIEQALVLEYRQYLAGHLSRPQPYLRHVDDDTEVGISHYLGFTADTPHVHPTCTEHGYVLSGAVRVRLLDGSGEEYEFHQGDFFVLRPGIPYASKNAAGTRVLFMKAPGKNDKTLVAVDEDTRRWLSSWDTSL